MSKGVWGSSIKGDEDSLIWSAASGEIAHSFATEDKSFLTAEAPARARALDVQALCCLRCCLAWTVAACLDTTEFADLILTLGAMALLCFAGTTKQKNEMKNSMT
jgi:hypothetical protein